jgi:hypothetical protein
MNGLAEPPTRLPGALRLVFLVSGDKPAARSPRRPSAALI